jgi:PAS domain S-box-containing protein
MDTGSQGEACLGQSTSSKTVAKSLGAAARAPTPSQATSWSSRGQRWTLLNRLKQESPPRKAFDEMEKSEDQLRAIISAIPTLAWSSGPDGSADFLNQRWLEYTGLSAEQGKGWGWRAAIHPDDVKRLLDYWESRLASGTPAEAEARMRRFDGAYRWFLFRADPLRDELGNIVKWYGTNTDIDDRKRVEEQLRRSEALMAESQRLSLTGSFMWRVANDEISDEITCSEQLYRIFELEQNIPVTLELIASRIHPNDVLAFKEHVEHCRRFGSDFQIDFRLQLPDRSVRHIHVDAHNSRDHYFPLTCHCPTGPSYSRYPHLSPGPWSTCVRQPSALRLGRTPYRAPPRRRTVEYDPECVPIREICHVWWYRKS